MSESKSVEFKTTDGVTLRGDFYQAKGTERPVVVMTGGLHLLKEHFLPAIDQLRHRLLRRGKGRTSPTLGPR